MKYNFSIECSSIIKLIHPGVEISDKYVDYINKDISTLMNICKNTANYSLSPILNEDYIKDHQKNPDHVLKMVEYVYALTFMNTIKAFNESSKGKERYIYAFLENMFFMDLGKLMIDNGLSLNNFEGDLDLDTSGLFGSELMNKKKIINGSDLLFNEDNYDFDQEYLFDEDELIDEFDYEDDFDEEDEDNYEATDKDYDKVERYCLGTYTEASEIEVKDISNLIDGLYKIYKDIFIADKLNESVIVVPIISISLRDCPSFIIKKNKNKIKYMINDNGSWRDVDDR